MKDIPGLTLVGSVYSLDLMLIPLPQVTLQPVQAPQAPVSHPAIWELESDSEGKGIYQYLKDCVLRCALFACLIL